MRGLVQRFFNAASKAISGPSTLANGALPTWALLLSAAVAPAVIISLTCYSSIYRLPTAFTDLSTGSLASLGGYKRADYILVVIAIMVVALATLLVGFVREVVSKKGLVRSFDCGLLWSAGIAAAAGLSTLIAPKGADDARALIFETPILILGFSSLLLLGCIVTALTLPTPHPTDDDLECPEADARAAVDPIAATLLLSSLWLAGVVGIGVAVNFVAGAIRVYPPRHLLVGLGVALVISGFVALGGMVRAGRFTTDNIKRLVIFSQLPILSLVLVMCPAPVWVDRGSTYRLPPEMTKSLGVFCLAVVIVSLGFLAVLWRNRTRSRSLVTLVSIPSVALVSVALHVVGQIGRDDYHYGEYVVPWQQLRDFGQLPYIDQTPARGILINYLPAGLADVLSSDRIASLTLGFAVAAFLLALIALAALRWLVGPAIGSLIVVGFSITDPLLAIDLLCIAVVTFLFALYLKRARWWWFPLAAAVGFVLLLAAPAQAALTSVAIGLTGIAVVVRLRHRPAHILMGLFSAGAIVALVLVISVPRKMTLGALGYVLEQGTTNDAAYGIPWLQTWDQSGFDPFRAAFIVFIGAGLVTLVYAVAKERYSLAVLLLAFVATATLSIPRWAGRIDPVDLSRIGMGTYAVLVLWIPVIVVLVKKRAVPMLAIAAVLMGIAYMPPPVDAIAQRAWTTTNVSTLVPLNDNAGTWAFGGSPTPQPSMDRAKRVAADFAAIGLSTDRVLDLTSHGADYYLQRWENPIEVTAIYNLTNRTQEVRAVDRLKANPAPLSLASDENNNQDGLSVSLRAPLIYRYVVESYRPFACSDGSIWATLGAAKRSNCGVQSTSDKDPELWQKAIGAPMNLGLSPASWGSSAAILTALRPVAMTSIAEPTNPRVAGRSVFIATPTTSATGASAGVLVLDTSCKSSARRREASTVKVSWANSLHDDSSGPQVTARSLGGRLVIPIDGYPDYLLGGGVEKVRLSVPTACRIDSAELMQREYVAQ